MTAAIAILATQPQQDLEDFASFMTSEQQTRFWEQIAAHRAQ